MLKLRQLGPALALAGLIAIAGIGFLFFNDQNCQKTRRSCIHDHFDSDKSNSSTYPSQSIGQWAIDNEKSIEPLTAIGSLFFAGALVFFTAVLWYATNKLATSTAELSAAEAANSAELRKASEIAEKQLKVSAAQVDIQKKQHEIGRLEYLAAHRPRLRIRNVEIEDGSHIHPTFYFVHGTEVTGRLVVVNVGGSKATIVDTRYRIFCTRGELPTIAPFGVDVRTDLLLCDEVLAPGQSNTVKISGMIFLTPPDPALGVKMRQFEVEGWKLYVMGQICYRDDGGDERLMGFCRERGKDGRFRAIQDLDYEYED
jgi:hypothetical protein